MGLLGSKKAKQKETTSHINLYRLCRAVTCSMHATEMSPGNAAPKCHSNNVARAAHHIVTGAQTPRLRICLKAVKNDPHPLELPFH